MGDNFNGVDPLEFLLQPVQEEFVNQLDFVDLQPVNLIEYITRAENELQNIVNTGDLTQTRLALQKITDTRLQYQDSFKLGFVHDQKVADDLLNEIKECYPKLFVAIDATSQHLAQNFIKIDPNVINTIQRLRLQMIKESLMVTKQPMGSNRIPQVVRRGPNIKPETLWLLANDLLRPYTQKRFAISPINVFLIQSRNNDPNQALHLGNANANPDTGIAEFSFNINNRVRRNNEGNPIEELYYFDFQAQITDYIDHLRGVPVEVSCRSNDLLVTVHANQDKRAAGRILWTNMGYEESVDQHQFKIMLNHYLRNEMVKDDQGLAGLTDQMVERIFEKVRELPGNEDMQTLRYIDFNRTTRQHTRQQADGRRVSDNATLWEWLYHAFEILNMPTIRTHWNQGFIVGFISKGNTEKRLKSQLEGYSPLPSQTGLIRFSDSWLGAISVARSDLNAMPQVTHHQVLRMRELVEESLYQRITKSSRVTYIAKRQEYAYKSEMIPDLNNEPLNGPPYDENI